MARRPASGRGWTDDGRATGKSFRHPLETWWKHEGRNRCAILTNCAQAAPVGPARNWRKPRNNSRSCAIVHGLFDTTHNLKVTGSNPVPATKTTLHIRDIESDSNSRVFACAFCVNAMSTFDESPRKMSALGVLRVKLTAAHRSGFINPLPPVSYFSRMQRVH